MFCVCILTLSVLFAGPNSVRELKAQTLNTTAVSLVWSKPQEYKNEYNYLVKTLGCDLKNKTVEGEETQIVELPPGTNCTFCVIVMAADGTEGEAQCTSQYTSKTLTCSLFLCLYVFIFSF